MKRGWATGKISAVIQQEKYPIKRIYTEDLCVQNQCSVLSPNSLIVCLLPTKVITVFVSNSTVLHMDVSKVSKASRGHLKRAVIFCSCYRHKYTSIPILLQPWAVGLIQMKWVLLWVRALSSSGTRRISSVTPLVAKKHVEVPPCFTGSTLSWIWTAAFFLAALWNNKIGVMPT